MDWGEVQRVARILSSGEGTLNPLSLRWVEAAVWNEVWHGVASDVVTPYDDGLVWEEVYGLG